MKKTTIYFLFLSIVLWQCATKKTVNQLTTIPKDAIDLKVDSVLALMTLDEKIGQTVLFTSDWESTGPTLRATYKADIKTGKVGAIFNAHTAAYTRDLQRIAVEETRLGIPLLFGYDVIHGYKTIFPIPLGEAASWDLAAIEKSARISAVEAAAAGLHWTFGPMLDIARDPRWGRVCEGAGEDVHLGVEIGKARVRGFQGKDLKAVNTVLACAKHYAAYGAAQAGRDYHTVDISMRTLYETYLPPFAAAEKEGVRTFMTSFNELDGVPVSGSKKLLTDILRKEWGFQGFVVTDYTTINEMIPHGFSKDEKHAGEQAINAGVDMDMQGAIFYNHLKQSIAEGKVSEETVETAARRILRQKFELGLFDDPYKYSNVEREKRDILSKEHLDAARDLARKSMVLLKNEKVKNALVPVLPLPKNLKNIAVIGALANSKEDLLGSWHGSGNANDCVSLLQGITTKLGDRANVIFAKGCEVEGEDKSGFETAIKAANAADAVVVAVGEKWWMSGEAASRSKLDLPGVQLDLVKELVKTGKPVVVVLMNGRPLTLPWIAENAPAILETWYAGTQGGHAIADVLFGDYNPSGKLPMTFPRSVGQIPLFYSMKNTGRPMSEGKYTSKYLDTPNSPQFAFGFGLSYTTFEYAPIKIDKMVFSKNDKIRVSVNVSNTGSYAGEEVVQLYFRDLVGSVTRPVKELVDFEKVMLQKGETKEISFMLSADDFAFFRQDMSFGSEAGEFEIFVGGSSETKNSLKVTLN